MAFSYSPNLNTAISRVRQMIGDTTEASARIQDETITYYLVEKSELATAAQLARDIASSLAGQVDSEHDGQSERLSQLYTNYMRLASDLQARANAETSSASGSDGSVFGGIGVFGIYAEEVIVDREDRELAKNLDSKWG
jgi:hypothetical protein